MATALENTIPCDRCNTPIDMRNWSAHVVSNLYCIFKYFNLYLIDSRETAPIIEIIKQKKTNGKEILNIFVYCFFILRSKVDNESDNDRNQCEYCDALISKNNWKSHLVNKHYFSRSLLFLSYIIENVC